MNRNKANQSKEHIEQYILKFSVALAMFFAVLGLVWGILVGSQMIIFDGLYSFISVVLSSLSVYAAWSMKMGDDKKFPFGRSQIEPLVVALKSIVIAALCSIAFSRAVMSLFSGGYQMDALSAMLYAVIATIVCLGGLIYLIWKRKNSASSELVKAECMQWAMDTVLSVAVLLGFIAALIMQHTKYSGYAWYMDPLMVIVMSVIFIKMPIQLLIDAIKEMLHMAPADEVYNTSKQLLDEIVKKWGFKKVILKMSKSGREFSYNIDFVSKSSEEVRSFDELDKIRQDVEDSIKSKYDNPIWLRVSFSG